MNLLGRVDNGYEDGINEAQRDEQEKGREKGN
jgi:hypothetical protein